MNLIKAPLHKINVIIFKIIFLKKTNKKKHTQLKYSTTVSFFESAGSWSAKIMNACNYI